MAPPTNLRFAMAVHLLTLLAQSPENAVDSRRLAVSPAINPVHVRRLLGRLRQQGMVTSSPGRRGGWTLSLAATEIRLGDVWRAVNTDNALLGLHEPDPQCPTGRRVRSRLLELDGQALDALLTTLDQVSIADMLNRPTVAEPPASAVDVFAN
jgi:Rrf2 family protein